MFKKLLGLLKSRTFWLNIALLGVYFLDLFGQTDFVKNNKDLIVIVAAIGNILMRFVTTKPLNEK